MLSRTLCVPSKLPLRVFNLLRTHRDPGARSLIDLEMHLMNTFDNDHSCSRKPRPDGLALAFLRYRAKAAEKSHAWLGLWPHTGHQSGNPLFLESRPLNVATGKGDLCQWGLTGTCLAITIYDSSPLFFTETYSGSNMSSSGLWRFTLSSRTAVIVVLSGS